MGCIGSRLTIVRNRGFTGSRRNSSRRQNVFPVLNVDDMGRQISPGKLEVTETDLVLHVRGKPSLTWPLRCLRRYGYDDDLLSFESGRRCPTGAGIFAFKCNRAESLFNLIQIRIQGNSGVTPNTVPSTPITPTNTCSNNPSTPVSSTFVYVNLSDNSTNRQTTNAPDVTQVSGSVPSSQTVPCSLNSMVSGCASSFPISQSYKNSNQLENNTHPLYMNVDSPATVSGQVSNYQMNALRYDGANSTDSSNCKTSRNSSMLYQNAPQLQHHQANSNPYVNYQSFRSNETSSAKDSILYTNVICSPGNEKVANNFSYQFNSNSSTAQESAEVNYAELDLKTDNPPHSSTCTNPLLSSSSSPSSSSATNKGRFSLLNNKENSKPSGTESKFKLKFGKPNPISLGNYSSSSRDVDVLLKKNLTGTHTYQNINKSPPAVTSDSTPKCSTTEDNGDLGYATIDFDRTAALSVVTRSKITLDYEQPISFRKTRHNSTAL